MISTQEAAERLSVSKSRVLELIKNNQLKAEKVSGIWLVDEASVNTRVRTANKKGGRPKRGSGKHEVRFMLMNRTHEIAKLVYNEEKKEFTFIGEPLDSRRAPLGLANNSSGTMPLIEFNAWWQNRGIPRTRNGLQHLLSDAGVLIPEELLYRNLGLSLSDQYWIKPYKSGLSWEDVNFFNNDFEQVSEKTKNLFSGEARKLHAHPNNTSEGNLSKEWIVRKGIRMLKKGGLKNNQEPFNEVVATALHKRLLSSDQYVSYELEVTGSTPLCVCSNFLTNQEEYVPAVYVMKAAKQSAVMNDFDHYVECCNQLGVPNIKESLERMIVCDDIMANTDRHWRNFGIVRNVETLECKPAPLFDTGTSLWCDADLQLLKKGEFSFVSKQFETSPARQMLLVEDMSWFNVNNMEGFVDEALEILAKNQQIEARLPYIRTALERRVARMINIVEWS